MTSKFEAFTPEHAAPVLVAIAVGWIATTLALRSSERMQRVIGTALSLTVLLAIVLGSLIVYLRGEFNLREDLPLYLCRIIAWTIPLVMWTRNRFWLGIFYFWILAGTLQAIITPDLAEGFPDYFYFRYWFLHAGLVVVIVYGLIIYRVRINWKDFWRAVLFAQLYIVVVHLLNLGLGSNYSYTVQKPPGGSVLDLFGPWPWYVLGGEILMFILFLVLMRPFARFKRSGSGQRVQ